MCMSVFIVCHGIWKSYIFFCKHMCRTCVDQKEINNIICIEWSDGRYFYIYSIMSYWRFRHSNEHSKFYLYTLIDVVACVLRIPGTTWSVKKLCMYTRNSCTEKILEMWELSVIIGFILLSAIFQLQCDTVCSFPHHCWTCQDPFNVFFAPPSEFWGTFYMLKWKKCRP